MNDQPKPPVDTPARWIRFAEGDLAVAEREMENTEPVHHTVCFLCQSAAEKFLKGYLIAQGWTLERTHDIVALLGYCVAYDSQWSDYFADGAVLNEYIVAGRYPGDITTESIGKREAKEALRSAQRIRSFVHSLMRL